MIDDVEAFRAAWRAGAAVEATARPEPRLQAAMDRLAVGVLSRVAHGSTVSAALKPFQTAIGTPEFTSDAKSLDATTFRDGDRWLVAVRMGFAASVSAYDRSGKRLAMPADLRWSFREFGGILRAGRLIAFDATSVSDAGVRYDYRLAFLRRTAGGYVSAGTATGFSNYDFDGSPSPRLVVKGDRVVVRGLDAPVAFFVSNAEPVLKRTETWDTSGPTTRRISTTLGDADVRAADLWLQTHRGTRLSKGFVVAKDNGMADSIARGKGWVQLDLDSTKLRFDLAAVGGKTVVRRVRVVP